MANPNIVNVTDIRGKTVANIITTSAAVLLENTAGSNKIMKVNMMIVSNIDGGNNAELTVDLYRNSVATHIIKGVVIPADSAFTPIDKNTPMYLEEGDAIRVSANANNDLEVICSYEEIS